MCTFKTFNSLRTHLARCHTHQFGSSAEHCQQSLLFKCPLCPFQQHFSESVVFCHLRRHLRNHETVACPYKDCSFTTNVYSTFNSHKSRSHQASVSSDFKNDIVSEVAQPSIPAVDGDLNEEPSGIDEDPLGDDGVCDTDKLKQDLRMNLSSLFLKMQAILHVSNTATQEIVEHLNQVCFLSQPLIKKEIQDILQRNGCNLAESALDEVVSGVMDSNVIFTSTSNCAELSTSKRRKIFFEHNYPCVMPIEYQLEQLGHSIMYVPILRMIQELFKNTDILKIITDPNTNSGQYASCCNGSYFLENELFSTGDLILPLQLYIDDLEIANPLGTSRKIHKLCAVYWAFANMPPKHRSTLHNIQLALLAKVTDIHKHGYAAVLAPLLRDVHILEQDGVFIERAGRNVKGTIFCVSADNLAAHGLSGFVESFKEGYVCRFCLATREQFKATEARQFSQRTKDSHDLHVQNLLESDTCSNHFGVKASCVLRDSLDYFHPITGFPPDVLHDLLEGIVPVELSLCIKTMIRMKYFTLEYLNQKIASFPYQHTDKVDRPHPIPKTFLSRGTIGGNGHENATLLRLLPLLVGSVVPEGDGAWTVLMELKEVVQLALCPSFTDETLDYFQSKISDHKQVLLQTFPEFNLRPKHHYVEHYPTMIKCFGPLVHVWTMRFEAKHRFFKRVVHDAQNFKNILKTMAVRHQHMMAYHLAAPSFFNPETQASSVDSVLVSALPEVAQLHIRRLTTSDTIYQTSKVTINGTDYVCGMFLSVGESGGLPRFCRVEHIYLVNSTISFLCSDCESWFSEHLGSYELSPSQTSLSIHLRSDLNDSVPLSAYEVEGSLLLTPKRFIQIKQASGEYFS